MPQGLLSSPTEPLEALRAPNSRCLTQSLATTKSLEVANMTSSLLLSPPSCLDNPRTANETRPNEGLETPPHVSLLVDLEFRRGN